MSFLTRTLRRLRKEDHGFSLMETVVALGVLFISLLVLARTAAVGFTDIALSRQRTQANQIANKVLEQVRGLSYARVGQGLQTADLAGDPNIAGPCADLAYYYVSCPAADPDAEKIMHEPLVGNADVPLVPHRTTYGAAQGYTSTFTASVYVTQAKSVPQTGAYRVTALVTWTPSARPGLTAQVTTQSLLYTPEGTTDAATGGGTAPFFYGTSSIGRAPITLTPNDGVTGGTGVTGLSVWESITEDLYGLDASVQQQQLARAESKAVMTGANKVVAGVETVAGGDNAEASADNDPATPVGPSSAPPGLMQSAVSSSIAGGGNTLDVEAASGGGVAPCVRPNLGFFTGFETGGAIRRSSFGSVNEPHGGMFPSATFGVPQFAFVESAVKRSGNYGLRMTNPGSNNNMGFSFDTPRPGVASARLALRFQTLPSGNARSLVRTIPVAGTRGLELRYESASQKLALGWDAQGGTSPVNFVQAASQVQAGTWYVIDLKVDVSANPHRASWRIDGVDQTSTSNPEAATGVLWFMLGGYSGGAQTHTVYYDDIQVARDATNYPLPEMDFSVLKPNSITSNNAARFQNENATAIDTAGAATTSRIDDLPMAGSRSDYVQIVAADTAAYVEIGFEDPLSDCIAGMEWVATFHNQTASRWDNGTTYRLRQGTTELMWGGLNQGTIAMDLHAAVGFRSSGGDQLTLPIAAPWTQSTLSSFNIRWGFAGDVAPRPYLDAIMLEFASVPTGPGPEGGAGTETGSTASTTSASVSTPCGNPTQLDGRPCSYAREDYSTAGPPHLSARLDLTGSGAGKAKIYKFQPSTQPGSTSYVWGRRTAGGGGAGTVKQTAVRYPGTHEFGALPSVMGAGPPGWPGYWVRYNAGTSAASVHAEAGVGSAPPTITSVGTISYYNDTCDCVVSMVPPTNGQSAVINVDPLVEDINGFRIEIYDVSLASSPSFTSQTPANAAGTADRTEAKAVLGSPVAGTFKYRITNITSGAVIADLSVSVDLGTVTATARYAP